MHCQAEGLWDAKAPSFAFRVVTVIVRKNGIFMNYAVYRTCAYIFIDMVDTVP